MLLPLISTLGRQKQVDLCEFKGSLVYQGVPGQPGLYRETLFKKQTAKTILSGIISIVRKKQTAVTHT